MSRTANGHCTGYFSDLHPDHVLVLTERGISEEQAEARGYYTETKRKALETLGFSRAQSSVAAYGVPVLVIPLHGPDGEIVNNQIRPNKPRRKKRPNKEDKIYKYELPYGSSICLACPPTERQRESLKAAVPLFITESALKADAGLSIGLLTIGILGVDGWRAKNAYEGITIHPHWEHINLKRDAYLVPDSDSTESRRVRNSLRRFKRWLESRGATIKIIWLTPRDNGSKRGLDDFIADQKESGLSDEQVRIELLRLATDEIPGESEFTDSTNESTFNTTDLGNAQRLVYRYGKNLRFCHKLNRWLVFDGRQWVIDDMAAVYGFAKETVQAIYGEAQRALEEEKRQELAKWALQSERLMRIEAMIKLASTDEAIAVSPDDLDSDPFLLNVNNGTIELRSGTLREHRSEDLITKLAPGDYDPDAKMPLIESFLAEIMNHSQELIDFIKRMIGYSLTGDTREQILPICYGIGANGKSTLLGLFQEMLGDYATSTSTSTLMIRRGESIPNDIAALKGTRFVTAMEVDYGQRLSESLVKQLTGGDVISARFMRGEWFTFKPTFKIWMAVNHKPVIRGTDKGIWRRVRLIPFLVSIPEDQQDKTLPVKLRAELPGLLAWAVAGCLEWQLYGLNVPDTVRNATNAYRDEMDIVGQFISEWCYLNESAEVRSSNLFEAWKLWAQSNGEVERTNKWFTNVLSEKGYQKKSRSTGAWWQGIGLAADSQSDDDSED